MKTVIMYIALATAPLIFSSVNQEHIVFAAAERGAAPSQDEKKGEERLEKDREGKKGGEDASTKEGEKSKEKKPSPKKKPRLKYWDDSRCAC